MRSGGTGLLFAITLRSREPIMSARSGRKHWQMLAPPADVPCPAETLCDVRRTDKFKSAFKALAEGRQATKNVIAVIICFDKRSGFSDLPVAVVLV